MRLLSDRPHLAAALPPRRGLGTPEFADSW